MALRVRVLEDRHRELEMEHEAVKVRTDKQRTSYGSFISD